MYICYIDEAGCPGSLPSATSDVQPILAISGLFLPQRNLIDFTRDFLAVKSRFNPSISHLEIARHEIKGADLRRDIRNGNRNLRRRSFGFLDKSLELMNRYGIKLVARIYVKQPTAAFDGKAVYTSSVQNIYTCFQKFLHSHHTKGIVIADSRTPGLNSIVSHSVFTQKFKGTGDPYPDILEMPTFGHSENHAAIQLTDFVCSALLYPIASNVYCSTHIRSVHVNPVDASIRERYANRLKTMSYRYSDGARLKGGITVNDAILHRSATEMFAPTAP